MLKINHPIVDSRRSGAIAVEMRRRRVQLSWGRANSRPQIQLGDVTHVVIQAVAELKGLLSKSRIAERNCVEPETQSLSCADIVESSQGRIGQSPTAAQNGFRIDRIGYAEPRTETPGVSLGKLAIAASRSFAVEKSGSEQPAGRGIWYRGIKHGEAPMQLVQSVLIVVAQPQLQRQ